MKELAAGDEAPDFIVPGVRCGEFRLSEKVIDSFVLLYFYPVNYGVICTRYIGEMNELYDEFEKLKIKVFHVNPDPPDVLSGWMDRTDSLYDHISDTGQEVSRRYGMIITHPEHPKVSGFTNRGFVLADRSMRIRFLWRADRPNDTLGLDEMIKELRKIVNGII